MLEQLVNADGGGYQGTKLLHDDGQEYEFKGYLNKGVLTVLGEVQIRRSYYYVSVGKGGCFPKDEAFDIEGTTFSPGVRRMTSREATAALSEKVVPIKTVPKLYIEIDGTGVPMVKAELINIKGKAEDGKAKTREAKLGCVFTQTTVDKDGRPVRDEGSTSYVGALDRD